MSDAHHFGAAGDGKTDDTAAIRHALENADGLVRFPRGDYLVTRTIEVDLARSGRLAIEGSGGTAKIVMAGPGPAFRIRGDHEGTSHPRSVKPEVWASQRMPTISDIEIEGRHAAAEGVELVGTMQATLTGVLVRECLNGVAIRGRNRNIVLQGCHVYHNTGIGVFLDRCNLHQVNITGCHVSFNRLAGLRIAGSEVRNLQITGNDIEYNNHDQHGAPPEAAAEIDIDCTGENASVREVTIASNTIQSTRSPGGANVRIVGPREHDRRVPGMWAISGNVIGSQEVNVHLVGCRGVSLTGNFIYSASRRNLLAERCEHLSIGSNVFGHNPDTTQRELATCLTLADCTDCLLTGIDIADAVAGAHTLEGVDPVRREGLVELHRCKRVNVTGCNFLNGTPIGLDLLDCSQTLVQSCQVIDARPERRMSTPVRWRGAGHGNRLAGNLLAGKPEVDPGTGVAIEGNTASGV